MAATAESTNAADPAVRGKVTLGSISLGSAVDLEKVVIVQNRPFGRNIVAEKTNVFSVTVRTVVKKSNRIRSLWSLKTENSKTVSYNLKILNIYYNGG